jgi:hypothetical protein
VLGNRGVFEVISDHQPVNPNVPAYDVKRIGDATPDELAVAAAALHDLRMLGRWE